MGVQIVRIIRNVVARAMVRGRNASLGPTAGLKQALGVVSSMGSSVVSRVRSTAQSRIAMASRRARWDVARGSEGLRTFSEPRPVPIEFTSHARSFHDPDDFVANRDQSSAPAPRFAGGGLPRDLKAARISFSPAFLSILR